MKNNSVQSRTILFSTRDREVVLLKRSSFFEGVSQEPVVVAGQPIKVPLFYYQGTSMTAVFPARYGALKRLMPDARFVPARLAPGLGVVAITAFEYGDTDVGPYNELAISVLLSYPSFCLNAPGRALLAANRQGQVHAYVHHLPVTTEVARAGGVDFYNYPKFIADIDFSQTADWRQCNLEAAGEQILTLHGRRLPTPRSQRLQAFSHIYMNRQPQSSEFDINATSLGVSFRGSAARLELGDRHPIARELAGLLVSRRPLQYQYSVDFEGILHGPDRISLPLMSRVEEARHELELVG